MKEYFFIGRYSYFASANRDCYYLNFHPARWSVVKVEETVKSYDRMMHQSLDKIFRERCLSSSGQIKEFLRGPQLKSIIKPILEQETVLSEQFSKEELGKLSLMWIAVLGCYEKSADLLVRSGADVNELFGSHHPQILDEKWTVLHLLLQMDPSPENERLIRLVIDQGADLQAQDCEGRTVLHYAARRSRVQIIELLLEKGADVNVADNDGRTPLLAACSYSNYPKDNELVIMSLLIKHGADVNVADDDGMTPLLFAASAEKANELVPLFMKHGADVLAKNRLGSNLLHKLALTPREQVDLIRVLIKKGVSLNDKEQISHHFPIHWAARANHNETVKLYLDNGANVNALTFYGDSLLIIAAKNHNEEVVKNLLEHGANVDLRNIDGSTALHFACQYAAWFYYREDNKWKCIIRLLLSAGADVLIEDCNGKTPFARMFLSTDNGERLGQESWPLIKALALRKALQPSIELKDERIIERHPKSHNYYRKCAEEIDRMKCTSFIETCTFFQLITKSQCQIAALMQNPEFETQFRLYDLNEFPIYAEVIVRAFERAQEHCNSLLEQVNLITEAFYNKLPYLVVKKVVGYIFNHCCSENMK